jgi:hypothetical protein
VQRRVSQMAGRVAHRGESRMAASGGGLNSSAQHLESRAMNTGPGDFKLVQGKRGEPRSR